MEGDFCCLFSLSEEVVYSKLFHRDGLKSRLVLILLHYRYTSVTFSITVNKGRYGAANVCPCVLHMHNHSTSPCSVRKQLQLQENN